MLFSRVKAACCGLLLSLLAVGGVVHASPNLSHEDPIQICGFVRIYPGDRPVAGAQVLVASVPASKQTLIARTETDSSGRFCFESRIGSLIEISVRARSGEYQDAAMRVRVPKQWERGDTIIELSVRDVASLPTRSDESKVATVRGVVRFRGSREGVPGAQVRLMALKGLMMRARADELAVATADEAGAYVIQYEGSKAGAWLEVAASECRWREGRAYLADGDIRRGHVLRIDIDVVRWDCGE